jgi:AbrB family looped-hinge helix DNA binding protein
MDSTTVKVSSRYQISIPAAARRQLNIKAKDRLLVDIQDGMLVLLPEPKDYVEKLAGLHREIWQGVDVASYLNEERAAWETSTND